METPEPVFYVGAWIDGDGCVTVTRDGATQPLNPRFDLREHSPTGFAWGYGGSGPAQLALALLANHFRDQADGDARAQRLYQPFKFRVIGRLPQAGGWRLTAAEIDADLAALA